MLDVRARGPPWTRSWAARPKSNNRSPRPPLLFPLLPGQYAMESQKPKLSVYTKSRFHKGKVHKHDYRYDRFRTSQALYTLSQPSFPCRSPTAPSLAANKVLLPLPRLPHELIADRHPTFGRAFASCAAPSCTCRLQDRQVSPPTLADLGLSHRAVAVHCRRCGEHVALDRAPTQVLLGQIKRAAR